MGDVFFEKKRKLLCVCISRQIKWNNLQIWLHVETFTESKVVSSSCPPFVLEHQEQFYFQTHVSTGLCSCWNFHPIRGFQFLCFFLSKQGAVGESTCVSACECVVVSGAQGWIFFPPSSGLNHGRPFFSLPNDVPTEQQTHVQQSLSLHHKTCG